MDLVKEYADREKYLLLHGMGEEAVGICQKYHVCVAGGAITALFTNARIRDYDMYFRSAGDRDAVRAAFLEKGKVVSSTDNALTIKWESVRAPFQLIVAEDLLGEPEAIFAKYDFIICMGAYDFLQEAFVLHPHFLKHIAQRRLVFHSGTLFPICSLLRAHKYVKRGYTITGVEIIKMGLAVHSVKIETFRDLRRQLMGIDTAFLKDLTDRFADGVESEAPYQMEKFLEMMDDYIAKVLPILDTRGEDAPDDVPG